jgi:hypothetical protein
MDSFLNTSTKRLGSETMSIDYTPACSGEEKSFKCLKTFQMWERLHNKKCALCRRAQNVYIGVDITLLAKSANDQRYKNAMRKRNEERMNILSHHI